MTVVQVLYLILNAYHSLDHFYSPKLQICRECKQFNLDHDQLPALYAQALGLHGCWTTVLLLENVRHERGWLGAMLATNYRCR